MQEIRKNIYILSDAHLGSLAIPHMRMQERRLVRFLDDIKHKAAAVYLLGDMFDFWCEWKYAVPKGYTRFLGKISELTDMGVEVHYFTGNHDIWMYGYLEQECGVILHRTELTTEIYGKVFFLAHGDGLIAVFPAEFQDDLLDPLRDRSMKSGLAQGDDDLAAVKNRQRQQVEDADIDRDERENIQHRD